MSKALFAGLSACVVALAIAAGWNYVAPHISDDETGYRFAPATRDNFEISTLATGRIEAVDSVDVSSQLSGQVIKLFADFNDNVTAGEPLAQLDDNTFKAAVAEAEARLAHAKASYDAALAKIVGTKARYGAAEADFRRSKTLQERGGISAQQFDKARAAMVSAQSDMSAAQADKAVQTAAIGEAEAALRTAQINLDRTIIRAPITGTVIKRAVDLGQTVAVSMKAETLFTIARNLDQMRVHARIDEADIGRIRVNQAVYFSVDAYPNRRFDGRVISIHRAPEIVQNVVTYTVVISAENRDLALLPGMTAIVHIVTTEQRHALLVPNAALQFHPGIKPAEASSQATTTVDARKGRDARVWVRADSGRLQPRTIETGKSDGNLTEVISGPLSEGELVAVGKQITHKEKTLFGIRLGF